MFGAEAFPDLLVGLGKADDAAVYRLSDERALVATVDFFTPVVDDPYAYGAIAAANAMSDVYAMGGRVILALNIAGFPPQLPNEVATEIIRGAAEKVREAGAAVAGGHTVQDKEPKFGLVALGLVDPRRVLTKGGAEAGDILLLTKPLGSGVVTTALKRELCSEAELAAATETMMALNRLGAEAAVAAGVKAMTDITGFGLIGHASEMLAGQVGLGFELDFAELPMLPGALHYGEQWVYPGGAHNNRAFFNPRVRFEGLSEWQELLCHCPETSGGLLMAVPPSEVATVLARVPGACAVGRVVAGEGLRVH